MRVLLLSPSSRPGGAERAFAGLTHGLAASGVETRPVLLEDGPLAEWLDAAGHPATLLPAHRFRRLDRSLATVLALRTLCRSDRIDIVVSCMSKGHVAGGVGARLASLPSVWWQMGIPTRTPLERTAAAVPASAVVCASDLAIAAQRVLTPGRRIAKIPLGVPVAELRARRGSGRSVRERLGWSDAFVVGIVARLEPWKGQETFLRAAARLSASDPRFRFVVVGGAVLGWEGSYPDDLERLARELGISDRTLFTGHERDPVPWIDALDVAVNASNAEPFGLSVLEAMSLGIPVVATNVGGPAEIITHGVDGLLFPPGDDAALAAAVATIAESSELATSLGNAAGQRAFDFDESRTAMDFAELFSTILGRPAPASD